jgi:lipopolysaccharide/colanic/teichoic acid biosynthesis glycosyltransferase
MSLYQVAFKRCADVALAGLALAALLPLLLAFGLLVVIDSPGSALFTQDRLGHNGRVFKLYKFRTMTNAPRVVNAEVRADNPELTRIGRWLRRFKVDELPQLWNVLRGDMSIVGPRPAMPEQEQILNADGRRRLEVRPGLTGLAQVSGNIYLSWEQRWRLDRQYVENLSFMLDVRIILRTVAVIAMGEERFKVQQ